MDLVRVIRGAALAALLAIAAAAGAEPDGFEAPRHDREAQLAEMRALQRGALERSGGRTRAAGGSAAPACGERLTEDTVLEEDLICAPSGVSVLLASGVTLDLAGHRIVGGVSECGDPQCGTGGEEIVLRNGTVEGFVFFAFCDRCVLDRLTVRGWPGFAVELGDLNLVLHSTFEDNHAGISNYFSVGRNWILNSAFRNNGVGVVVGDTNGNVIWHNAFADNDVGVLIWDEELTQSADNVVARNTFVRNGTGAALDARNNAQRNYFGWNHFWGNRGAGLSLHTECGFFLTDHCGGFGSLVVHNLLLGNGADGISVSDPREGNDGLTLTKNRAFSNAELGIDAPGVVDGGGNVAANNGDRRQCVGVECRGRP